jgi:hypothetical protein
MAGRSGKGKYWSADVTEHSNALDLEPGVFTWTDPRRIAESLKHSAETSTRRKGTPLHINRAGTHLAESQRRILEQAKVELRALFTLDRA